MCSGVFREALHRGTLWYEKYVGGFNVRQKTDARYSYRPDVCLSVCPSVRPSVTRWYCVKTAQPIVKLFSLPGSPMILVF